MDSLKLTGWLTWTYGVKPGLMGWLAWSVCESGYVSIPNEYGVSYGNYSLLTGTVLWYPTASEGIVAFPIPNVY